MISGHAFQIETDDGTGNPVAFTDTDYGFDAGIGYLVTGRLGLDGSKTVTGDTDRDTWYEGLLPADFSGFSCTRSADFIEAGCVSVSSSLSFALMEKSGLRAALQAAGVHLARCRVTYFYVESADGVTFGFAQRWTGVIDELPYNRTRNMLRCIDNSKDIFASLPITGVDEANFPGAESSSKGKIIPIALGRVAYSPLVNVHSAGEYTALVSIDGVDRLTCTATTSNTSAKTVDLYTAGRRFAADDVGLVGRFLVVTVGGADQSIRIISNDATDPSTEVTKVYLDHIWEGSMDTWDSSDTSLDVWYFRVRQYSADFLSSEKPVSDFLESPSGQTALYAYDQDAKRYLDISELKTLSNLSSHKGYGHPGLEAIIRRFETDGAIALYLPIRPSDIIMVIQPIGVTGLYATYDGPAEGESQPNLFDGDQSSGYIIDGNATAEEVVYDIYLPTADLQKSFDEVYLLMDIRLRRTTGSLVTAEVLNVQAKLVDLHGRATSNIFGSGVRLYGTADGEAALTGTATEVYTLPGVYYNGTENPDKFFTKKTALNITSLVGNAQKMEAYPRIRLTISAAFLAAFPYEIDIREIGIVGKKTVGLTSDTLYHTLRGEVFGTAWCSPSNPTVGRRSNSDAIDQIGDALEHLIRNYDYNHPIWTAGKAYKVGERIRSTADSGLIYICTVAGTSHASSEPAFPVVLGDTVTDGTVTWRALDALKIDCNSFDALAVQRPSQSWSIGRTLTDKKSSVDYYQEFAKHGFFGILTDARGRVSVKAWRENTSPTITFSPENILQGTLSEVALSPMRRVSNDFLIQYDKNAGAGTFNKQLFVTRVDEPSFPESMETIVPGIDLGTFMVLRYTDPNEHYRFEFACDSPHGLVAGDFVFLHGNTKGFDFPPLPVSDPGGAGSTNFTVTGHLTEVTLSNTGTLRKGTDARLKWKSFVGGIQSYALAKTLWEQCRASYLITKTVQKLPRDLGECPLFIDPEVADPAGNQIWTDLSTGDDHAAVHYLANLAAWTTFQKKQVSFEVANNSTHRALGLMDPVYFLDSGLTDGVARMGWIHEIIDLPGSEKQPDRIRFGVTLNPDQLEDLFNIIDENGADPADIIDENGADPGDIIDENGA